MFLSIATTFQAASEATQDLQVCAPTSAVPEGTPNYSQRLPSAEALGYAEPSRFAGLDRSWFQACCPKGTHLQDDLLP